MIRTVTRHKQSVLRYLETKTLSIKFLIHLGLLTET